MYVSIFWILYVINPGLDSRIRSNKPPGPAGRNKFEELSSPFLPPPIVAWRDALKRVVVDPDRDATVNQLDRGYVFPDPGLFLGVGTPETQAKFFYNWVKYRLALIYRLTAPNSNSKPLSSQVWRSMLHLPIDEFLPPPRSAHTPRSTLPASPFSLPGQRSVPHNRSTLVLPPNATTPAPTKSAKRLEVIHALLENCLNVDGVRVNDMPTNEIFWQQRQLSATSLPGQQIAQEILWELFELNFRFEFMALDSRAHIPPTSATDVPREDLLLKCFAGNIGGSILVAQREFAHQGLAASSWMDRAPLIVAIRDVVRTWPGFEKVVQGCTEVDVSVNQEIETYSESEINAMEQAIATFYTQSFYDFFGRAAIIPRRLPPKQEGSALE